MSFYVVIPARYASTRLPAKPLKMIAGKPMIQHVYERACLSGATRAIIASDDERIRQAAEGFGAAVCMTSAAHNSGTDRLQEVASQLQLTDEDILVNVQGDEPLIPPQVIDQVARLLAANPQASVATLCEPIHERADFENPNIVKLVADQSGRALYFSRAPIPFPRDHIATCEPGLPESLAARRHIGIDAYRVALLNRFDTWEQAPLEKLESLEQLRVLWQCESIQ